MLETRSYVGAITTVVDLLIALCRSITFCGASQGEAATPYVLIIFGTHFFLWFRIFTDVESITTRFDFGTTTFGAVTSLCFHAVEKRYNKTNKNE
jgi:hypothetical protein